MSSWQIDPHSNSNQDSAGFRVLIALLFVLALRLVHLGAALQSPLTYQPGPDEDFYLRFGQEIAQGGGINSTEFVFMDPAYGYILGLIFKLFGPDLFAVYFIQILLDTLTAYCLFLIGRQFGRPGAGIIALLLYGLTCTAIMYSATLLKATWVANYMTLWVLSALLLLKTQKLTFWWSFGIFCGYGMALRSNLLLMVLLTTILLPWLQHSRSNFRILKITLQISVFFFGVMIPVLMLSQRNSQISDSYSPIPNNGGIVLHQLYNAGNPMAVSSVPDFVNFYHPSEIWRSYAAEAKKRVGHDLKAKEVDQYWREQAFEFISLNSTAVLGNGLRKFSEFFAITEVSNNRSLVEERLFSPVLMFLPSPFGWLIGLGLPGIIILLYRDKRAILLIAPIAVTVFTVTIFFAESRFRFHAVPMLALGSGLFITDLYSWIYNKETGKWITGFIVVAVMGILSILSTRQLMEPKITWDRIVWGYIKMGDMDSAKKLTMKIISRQPANIKMLEAMGFLYAYEKDYSTAAIYYKQVVVIKPDAHNAHYNLAKILYKTEQRKSALTHAQHALKLSMLPDYQKLIEEIKGKHNMQNY